MNQTVELSHKSFDSSVIKLLQNFLETYENIDLSKVKPRTFSNELELECERKEGIDNRMAL